jgi:hypothetical protein
MENEKIPGKSGRLSEQDLRDKMDFDKFIKDYKPRPLYKRWQFYFTIAAAALLIYGTFLISTDENDSPSDKNNFASSTLSPPFKNLDIPFTTFLLRATADTILQHPDGSLLHIPAEAFLDQKGHIITGTVELRYRELHDVVDFFLSGVPLNYDSAGKQYSFESSGMLELRASQNGAPVYSNPEQLIEIGLISPVQSSSKSIYFLDTLSHKWISGKQSRKESDKSDPGTVNPWDLIKEPRKADGHHAKFNISYNKTQFPELSQYEGVAFEISGDNQHYDPKTAMKDWETIRLERAGDGLHYLVTFANGNDSHTFRVQPVFEGSDYSLAVGIYQEKVRAYEKALSAAARAQGMLKRKADSAYQVKFEMPILNSGGRPVHADQSNTRLKTFVRHRFEITHMGFWNSSSLSPLPREQKLSPVFLDENDNKLSLSRVFVSETGRNLIHVFGPDSYVLLAFNPGQKNILWAITGDGRMALADPDMLKKLRPGKEESLRFKVLPKQPASAAEIRKMLGIRNQD